LESSVATQVRATVEDVIIGALKEGEMCGIFTVTRKPFIITRNHYAHTHEGQDRWRRRAPVGPDAHSEDRAVCIANWLISDR
jgi:hypothetical protein